jgi:hypothetical protein
VTENIRLLNILVPPSQRGFIEAAGVKRFLEPKTNGAVDGVLLARQPKRSFRRFRSIGLPVSFTYGRRKTFEETTERKRGIACLRKDFQAWIKYR